MAISSSARAEGIWRKIQRKPVPGGLVLTRQAVITDTAPPGSPITLPAQTVRISRDNRPREIRGATGEGTENHCVVYGVKGHPDAAVPDTDIQRGDRFELDGDHFIVDNIKLVPGGVQAIAVLQGIGT